MAKEEAKEATEAKARGAQPEEAAVVPEVAAVGELAKVRVRPTVNLVNGRHRLVVDEEAEVDNTPETQAQLEAGLLVAVGD